jgi:hypothetical protein
MLAGENPEERRPQPRTGPRDATPRLFRFQNRHDTEASIIETGGRPVAWIVIPLYVGSELHGFATKIQSIVTDLAAKAPCGWVVDLRGNGGDMWTMLAGLGCAMLTATIIEDGAPARLPNPPPWPC